MSQQDRQVQDDAPVFVRGFSRSGGTLMVTILDAHPDIAMSYELYPTLLAGVADKPDDLLKLASRVGRARNMKAASKRVKHEMLRRFVVRCERGGLTPAGLAKLLREHAEAGESFADIHGRMSFLGRCARAKQHASGKKFWGMKCNSAYEDYLREFPKARFINMVRDGRDVLASQLSTGSFSKEPAEVGRSWAKVHKRFQFLMDDPFVRSLEVRYEYLVQDPTREVERIFSFLELPCPNDILNFHQRDLTIYDSSHLSMERISKPVDAQQVGRWKRELNDTQLEEFYSTARETMHRLHYL